jgi:hypothetical protein
LLETRVETERCGVAPALRSLLLGSHV